MLTAAQLISILTRSSKPPFRMGDMRSVLNVSADSPLSLQSVMDGSQKAEQFFFVEVREASQFVGVNTLAEFQQRWRTTAPSRVALTTLIQLLNSGEITVNFLSPTWQTVGLKGTMESFSSAPAIKLETVTDGLRDLANGAMGAGALLIATSNGNEYVAGFGAMLVMQGVQIDLYLGYYELMTADSSSTFGTISPPRTVSGVTISGSEASEPEFPEFINGPLPPKVAPSDVRDLGDIDVIDIGDIDPPLPPDGPSEEGPEEGAGGP
jgi:hypothetical protein